MRIVTLNAWKNEGRYDRRLALMAEGLAALAGKYPEKFSSIKPKTFVPKLK